ncbi:two-component regulator propeller domain-containing protein [Profundibacterium mesophilum]|uniref:histidine kinase n=1 Tax=Profundibacterium mesophilum KAUST100406-0324 TaxID=1037889 RepID=A0A921NW73_9RHOB|nr:two-component regulator propeller domain-containing protein [Profundibacterium mesophilum]KAF0675894.1 ATPase [Profundibacterium mesophilum KAUST100406-0324]
MLGDMTWARLGRGPGTPGRQGGITLRAKTAWVVLSWIATAPGCPAPLWAQGNAAHAAPGHIETVALRRPARGPAAGASGASGSIVPIGPSGLSGAFGATGAGHPAPPGLLRPVLHRPNDPPVIDKPPVVDKPPGADIPGSMETAPPAPMDAPTPAPMDAPTPGPAAAPPRPDAPPPIMPRRVTQVGLDQGLSASLVSAFAESDDGRIWIATNDGISIFDGESVEILYREPSGRNGLRSDYVTDLTFDHRGALWIATYGGGLTRYDPASGAGDVWHGGTGAVADDVHVVEEGRGGRIWIGSDTGLAVFDPVAGAPIEAARSIDSPVRAILPVPGGLMLGTDGEGLFHYEPESGRIRRIATRNAEAAPRRVSDLLLDSAGHVWAGFEDGGLWHGAAGDEAFAQADFLPATDIPALAEDEIGRLWVATWSQGIFIHDPQDGSVINHRAFPGNRRSLPSDTVTALRIGPRGTAWIGTYDSGIAYGAAVEAAVVSYVGDPGGTRGPPSAMVWALTPAASGGLWVGTAGGLSLLSPNGARFRKVGAAGEDADIRDILREGGDLLLAIRRRGIIRLENAASALPRVTARALREDYVRLIRPARSGGYWVGTHDGLVRLDAELAEIARYRPGTGPGALPHARVRAIETDPTGRLWIGTSGGLSLYDPEEDRFTTLTREQGLLRDNDVRGIHVDPGDPEIIWAATGGGLSRIDLGTRTARHVGRADGLLSESLYAVRRDRAGRLWLPSSNGLVRYDPNHSGALTVFGARNGLQGPEYNFNAFADLPDGRMAMGGVSGLSIFNPMRLGLRTRPPVLTTDVTLPVAGQPPRLRLDARVIEFTDPPRNRLDARLLPVDTQWRSSDGVAHSMDWDRLAPGPYSLQVRYAGADGTAGPVVTAAQFLIPTPFWQSLWGRLLTLLGAAALLWMLIRGRLHLAQSRARVLETRVARKTAELTQSSLRLRASNTALSRELEHRRRFYMRMSHELRGPLAMIAAPLADAGRTERIDTRLLAVMRRASDQLGALVREMAAVADALPLEPRRVTIDLDRLVIPVLALHHERAAAAGSGLRARMPQTLGSATLDNEALETILGAVLSDAVERVPAQGTIETEIALSTDRLHLSVATGGPGPSPEALRGAQGFAEGKAESLPRRPLEIAGAAVFDCGGRMVLSTGEQSEGLGGLTVTIGLPCHTLAPSGPLQLRSLAPNGAREAGERGGERGAAREDGGDEPPLLPAPGSGPSPRAAPEEAGGAKEEAGGAENEAEGTLHPAAPRAGGGDDPAKPGDPPMIGQGEILVLEDDSDLCEYICEVLSALGPARGVRSLAAARRALNRHPIGLLVSDVILPDGNALDLIAEIRDAPEFAQLAVVILTGHDDRLTRGRASDLATEQFLAKPFKPEELLARCTRSLRVIAQMRERLASGRGEAGGTGGPGAPPVTIPFDARVGAAFEAHLDAVFAEPRATLAQAAQACGLSERSLQRFLARDGGGTFRERLQARRMAHASALLRAGTDVETTARACGFSGAASFSRSFRAATGMTPGEARGTGGG